MSTSSLLPPLQKTAKTLTSEYNLISEDRKKLISGLSSWIEAGTKQKKKVFLNFICTHNSRRSHISQLWAQAAAHYYNIPDIICLSGGTEATAFNPRAVKAMQNAGFNIIKTLDGNNPRYEVTFAESAPPLIAFSKKYDDPFNSCPNFAAVMTCSHADENCPLVLGASFRIALTYNDPKEFDGTPLESAKYQERVEEIGREILYGFSLVKK